MFYEIHLHLEWGCALLDKSSLTTERAPPISNSLLFLSMFCIIVFIYCIEVFIFCNILL